jgi:hypothetical protein
MVRRKFEKPQKRNPHRLSIRQHIWPLASIARFTDKNGVVRLFDIPRSKVRAATPGDDIFCTKRAWDQRAETGFMKSIEDAFQDLASEILAGNVRTVGPSDKRANEFFSLWHVRARFRSAPDDEIALAGAGGDDLTKDQEEVLESKWVSFVRKGAKMPARMLYGLRIQMEVDIFCSKLAGLQWGVICAQEGHFVVPDLPHDVLIPIAPEVSLWAGSECESITRDTLAAINRRARCGSAQYFFAQDLDLCP